MVENKFIAQEKNIFQIDEQSFEKIYNLYWEKVYAVCYNAIREVEPSRGLVQEIFKSLWERRADLKIVMIENYLVRSARFKAFEFIRNKVNHRKHVEIKFQDCCLFSNCTEDRVLFTNLVKRVDLLVDTLPCQCKRVFKMSRDQGFTNKEIASALLISERAVEYHITKALSTLRTNLAGYTS